MYVSGTQMRGRLGEDGVPVSLRGHEDDPAGGRLHRGESLVSLEAKIRTT